MFEAPDTTREINSMSAFLLATFPKQKTYDKNKQNELVSSGGDGTLWLQWLERATVLVCIVRIKYKTRTKTLPLGDMALSPAWRLLDWHSVWRPSRSITEQALPLSSTDPATKARELCASLPRVCIRLVLIYASSFVCLWFFMLFKQGLLLLWPLSIWWLEGSAVKPWENRKRLRHPSSAPP